MSRQVDIQIALDRLAALSQPTRLSAFRLLVKAAPEGLAAGLIAADLDVPHNTLSTHLGILERAGLVSSRRDGRSIVYGADLASIRVLLIFLGGDCCDGRPEICAPLVEVARLACSPRAARARRRA